MTDSNPQSLRLPLPLRARRVGVAALVWVFVLAGTGRVEAQQAAPADSQLLADTLFRSGRQLMEQGSYAEACRKLEESYRLDAAPGTLLALATCHEAEGRVAKAWGEFNQALAIARRDGRADREGFAREHVTQLESVLPKVIIDVPAESRASGLLVTRNGSALTETSWGLALPSDPGDVVITAEAPGHKPWSQTIKMEKGQTAHVAVPKLEEAPVAPVAPVAPAAPKAVSLSGTTGETSKGGHDFRTFAYVAGGIGVVAAGFGTYFGVTALSKQHESDNGCPYVGGARQCTQAGVSASSSAVSNAHLADVTLGVGIAGLVTGTVLYLVSTKGEREAAPTSGAAARRTAVHVVPTFTQEGGGVVVLGAF